MNILYIITGLGGGGAEKVVADLANQMYKRGHQVKIAYLKGSVVVHPEQSEIDLVYLGLESVKDTKKAYQKYKALLLSFQPDVVHAHMVHANIFARISRKFCEVPKLICTAHSNNEGGRLRMLTYRLTHNMSDVTTNVSQSACESFENLGAVPRGGIRKVYNGINLERFNFQSTSFSKIKNELNLNENQILFLAVGRFHEAKDYPNLIDAFAKLIRQNVSGKMLKLAIVGDGDLKDQIQNKIIDLSLQKQIILLGRRNDISDLMSASDFFVLSSSFEGFGLVVAEAMACKCYVIATDCGGVKEVMGGYGQLSLPHNSALLAEKLNLALNISKRDRLKNNENALKYVKNNFDLQRIIDQWLEIYASK
ncbi:glycosyltransferase [Acinetobacter guillouiae]|uniref:glycosyltransferase n=1 Tax=Acinetobacter guillouiae TaxID=106649 RepID=UPI003D02E295